MVNTIHLKIEIGDKVVHVARAEKSLEVVAEAESAFGLGRELAGLGFSCTAVSSDFPVAVRQPGVELAQKVYAQAPSLTESRSRENGYYIFLARRESIMALRVQYPEYAFQ